MSPSPSKYVARYLTPVNSRLHRRALHHLGELHGLHLQALEASYDCDPHEVVCSKLFKKMMEVDWRTTAKAL